MKFESFNTDGDGGDDDDDNDNDDDDDVLLLQHQLLCTEEWEDPLLVVLSPSEKG